MSQLVYVYGFIADDAAAVPPGLVGVGDAPVEVVPAADFRAVVSRVPEERYAPERIEARLDDLRWVGEQGLAHERVVAAFLDRGDIVPVPLFTLYSGLEALEAEAAERRDLIAGRLRRFAGRHQWDIKIAYRSAVAAAHVAELSPTVRALDDEIAAAAPGRRYLLERKRAQLARDEVHGAVSVRAAKLLDALAAHAEEVVRLPLPQAERELPVVLFAALLVHRDAEPQLIAEAERLAAENEPIGIDLGFSGPWAPYRFMADNDA